MEALVIDYDNEWAHLLQGALYNKGYTAVERAGSWREALHFLADMKTWDLVVSVLHLPQDIDVTSRRTKTWTAELRQKLRQEKSCPVVFIQDSDDYEEYAEVKQKFPCTILKRTNYTEATLDKFIADAQARYEQADWLQAPFKLVYKNTILQNYIFLEDNQGYLHMLDPKHIFYLKSHDKHAYVFEQEGSPYVVRKSIASVSNDLPKDSFFSPHRGFIVNIRHISYIAKEQRIITLTNKVQVPMSHSLRDTMLDLLKIW